MFQPCTIGDFVDAGIAFIQTGPFGTQLKASEYVSDGIPVINVRNIGYSDLRADKLEYITDTKAEQLSVHRLEPQDIVFGRKGAVDRHLFVQPEHAGWVQGSDCIRMRIECPEINPRFISYALLSEAHKKWMLNQCGNKATMASLNQDVVKRIQLNLPERSIQDDIVAVLSAYDDLIENNRRRAALLEEPARQLYKEWFVRFRFPGHEHVKIIDGVPEGWENVAFEQIADVLRGRSYTSAELRDEGGRAFVNLKCINRFGGFRRDGIKGIEGDFKEKHMVSPGDIVMAVTDMTRDAMIVAQSGRVSKTVEDRAIFSMDLVKIVPKPGVQRDWLYSMLRFSNFAFQVREHATGTNVLHLKPKYVEGWVGPLPPKNVRDWFAETVASIFDQIDNVQLQSNAAAKARNLLLPRLMNGRLAA